MKAAKFTQSFHNTSILLSRPWKSRVKACMKYTVIGGGEVLAVVVVVVVVVVGVVHEAAVGASRKDHGHRQPRRRPFS